MSTCQKLILNVTTDRLWRFENRTFFVYDFWCQLREIHPLKDARAELQWPVYACDMCDWWSNINLGVMLSLFLKHVQAIFNTFLFWFWAWEQFSAGTACFDCLAQILVYMCTWWQHFLGAGVRCTWISRSRFSRSTLRLLWFILLAHWF